MPRKTTKKPTTKKVAAKKTAVKKAAPKRKKYQTGGTAKPQMPRSQALARERAAEEARVRAEENRVVDPTASQYADRINATMQRYRRERGLMELGNRQRAAAARARARSGRGPTAAERARNMAEYERAMRARQANLSRGSTPSPRPVPQPRPNPRPAPPSPVMNRQQYQQELQNRIAARPPATSINVGGGRALPAIPNPNYRPPVRPTKGPQMRTPTPQELARLRANPNRPSMTNQVQTLNQGNALKRQRIQQQIAQLQAQLRQLGG